ncbi:MAG: methyltransferase domain-containing protein [Nitrospirota bacterium]|nr:methyltransferase domain-containing protein [Nitrospirota bacterium]MDE3224530.1 methyltransferase domain-containing protein [Nitrospirota bacterium]MDE3241578.1 methyltransferase domain-containing protein [Nitrospirota bacterium]
MPPTEDLSVQPIRSFEEFRDAVAAYRLPRILIAALELDLFTAMGGRGWTIPTLAKRVRASRRGLDILCRNLASVGLLRKQGVTYRNGPLGLGELNAHSPAYRGAYLNLLKDHWADWSQLTEHVRSGKPLEDDKPDDAAYRKAFTWAMHHRSMDIAPRVAAQVGLEGAKTFLDLGGGPGTYALAFLAKHPRLQATVADRAPALEVAREIAETHPAGKRLSYVAVDFVKRPIPGRYDVIWYSNVLHIYSPAENQRVFHRAAAALNPGGRLLIQDAFLQDVDGLHPQEANLFAVTMLLFTRRGNTYTVRETEAWLRRAGFGRVKPVTLRAGTGDWDGGILEASLPSARPGSRARRGRSARNSPAR